MLACFSALGYGQIYVDIDATGNNDGSTWADAYVDLQDALAAALPDDEIWVAAGTYVPGTDTLDNFELVEGVRLFGGFAGTETSEGERDPATNVTILSGDPLGNDVPGDSLSRTDNVFHVLLADTFITNATIVDGFTITGGNSLDPAAGGLPGIIRDSGGGLLSVGSPVLSNCIFTQNFASRGGGIYVSGDDASSIKILNCTFDDNDARFGGGVMFISLNGGLIDNCTFTNNSSASSGSAFYNGASIDTVLNSTFTENLAGRDGAIAHDGSIAYYENLDFDLNEAARLGAAMVLFSGEPTFENCTFSNGLALRGGAFYVFRGAGVFNNCEFASNSATGLAGAFGIQETDDPSALTLNGCSFSGHTAGDGGVIFSFGGITEFNDCEFTSNSSEGGGVGFIQGGNAIFNGCLLEGNTGADFGGAGLTGFGASSSFTNCEFITNQSSRLGGAWWTQNDFTTNEFIGCEFIGNTIQGGTSSNGNALAFGQGSSNIIDSCYFEGNNNGFNPDFGSGGAVWFSGDTLIQGGNIELGSISITRSQFISNQASVQGGAIDLSSVNATVENCVFAFNQSTAGTIINNAGTRFGSPLTLTNNTFYFNLGTFGSGLVQWENPADSVMAEGSATIQNNIFVEGDGPAYAVEDGTPTLISNGGNLFKDESLDTAVTADDMENVSAEDIAFTNADLADFTLTENSIAIDAGVNTGAPTVDITGEVRLSGENMIVDAGAYESGFKDSTDATNNYNVEFDIEMSPTVTNDNVTINFNSDNTGEIHVMVFDHYGRRVMHMAEEKSVPTFRRTYTVGHLPAGNYFVRVLTDGKIGGGQFIVAQ